MNCPNCQRTSWLDRNSATTAAQNSRKRRRQLVLLLRTTCARGLCARSTIEKSPVCARESRTISISIHSWSACCGRWQFSARGQASCSISSSGSPCRKATRECPRHRLRRRPRSLSPGENLSTFRLLRKPSSALFVFKQRVIERNRSCSHSSQREAGRQQCQRKFVLVHGQIAAVAVHFPDRHSHFNRQQQRGSPREQPQSQQ